MRSRSTTSPASPKLRRTAQLLISGLTLCLGLSTLTPAAQAAPTPAGVSRSHPGPAPQAATPTSAGAALLPEQPGTAAQLTDAAQPLPLRTTKQAPAHRARSAAAACNVADFTSKTGSALVAQIKASDTPCVNTLFGVSGTNAAALFREAQMVTVADAVRATAANYPGNNSGSLTQLVLYLRAGYYVQYGQPDTVGSYGPALKSAVQGGLDTFFGSAHAFDVSEANGETLAESVTLIDSAGENARYLSSVVSRLLKGYDASYDPYWWMVAAVNNTYTVLFRGHYLPEFVSAVQSDQSVLATLRDFAVAHDNLLGTDKAYLTANAGLELGRFLQHSALQTPVRPLAKQLIDRSTIPGRTAALWVGVARMTDAYDQANCAYYGTCDLRTRVRDAVLTVKHTCAPTLRIVAQDMTTAQLDATCTSLLSQDAYFHGVVKDNGPVADDNNTTLEVVAFDSSTDYQTYAGIVFGIDTDNGGMYLEGDPAAAGNQPRFIAYEAEWLRPDFQIWNLNHEYTHYLDGRFDMYGDFAAGQSTPTVMWVEGFAEYINYSYRGATYDKAITEAGKNTYRLSTLFDTTYENTDTVRTYQWGYLAVRYLIQSHPQDVAALLGHYRAGDWNAARTLLTSTIGTRYDADFAGWLTRCAAGDCGGSGSGGAPECTASDTRELGQDCARTGLAATNGNYKYFYVKVPAGTASLTVTSGGGTGDGDLYYNPSAWATTSAYTVSSVHSGNAETLTVHNPPAGYVYVSLYAKEGFDRVSVTSRY
ncbi:M9 family metallopeptidase [Streptomyces sp. NPDC050085]|uniref:M9 family metallopeptidase n=1 Tax=Streptomyces sp. NPDC050085 TaxID=3365600 RepID=UPI0037B96955